MRLLPCWKLSGLLAATFVALSGASCAEPDISRVSADANQLLGDVFALPFRPVVKSVKPREADDRHTEFRVLFDLSTSDTIVLPKGCRVGDRLAPGVVLDGGELRLLYRKVGRSEWQLIANEVRCTSN